MAGAASSAGVLLDSSAMTRQRLGQHFLANPGWRAQILERIGPRPGDVWTEIGAGAGEMTRELAALAKRVVAIEFDPRLVEKLRRATAGLDVEIVSGDVLKLDLPRLLPPHSRVYGSLPYYIASPILRRLFCLGPWIEEIDVVIQREVAERLAARPGRRDYGWLSVLAQAHTRPEILLRIPPGAFQPPPKVHSALVRLVPPGEAARLGLESVERFLEFAERAFAHKRKTLVNNLKGDYGAESVSAALGKQGRGPKARAEELSVAELAQLWKDLAP